MYATLFYGVLDRHGRFEYVNAGHVPPMVLRAGGKMEVLESPNFPVGMFEMASFSVSCTDLRLGDEVLIFSDGLTEAQNEAREMLGEARVQQILESCAAQRAKPEEVCSTLVRAAEDFVGSAPQADDVTVALLQFAPPAP
jgi:phosphoserine phosphatase RsbU/P